MSDALLISLMILGLVSGMALELGLVGVAIGLLMVSLTRLSQDPLVNRRTGTKLFWGGACLLFAGFFGFLMIKVTIS